MFAGLIQRSIFRAPVAAAAAVFTPASLSPAIWIEADPTKLYTDAGTTLVTADGQSVQQANDKSGNSRHLTMATAGQRPLYKTAGPYLLFDGSDDAMESGLSLPLVDGSGQCWLAFCGQLADLTTNQHFALVSDIAVSDRIRLMVSGGNLSGYADSGSVGLVGLGAVLTLNTQFVVVAQLTTSQLEVYVNNGAAVTGATSTGLTTTACQLYFMARASGSNFANGRGKAILCGPGVLTGGNRSDLYTYLAAL